MRCFEIVINLSYVFVFCRLLDLGLNFPEVVSIRLNRQSNINSSVTGVQEYLGIGQNILILILDSFHFYVSEY
jgi:hypothetical protein